MLAANNFKLSSISDIVEVPGDAEHGMTARWARTLYWIATLVACLIVLWDIWDYVSGTGHSYPVVTIGPLLLAAFIWLAGLACRKFAR